MGAGNFPAGVGPAGLDPVYVATPTTPGTFPTALAFDPGLRGYVQNADGTMKSIDPVDAEVALLLGIEQGSIPSAATLGQKLRAVLTRTPPSKQKAIATQEVLRVLGPLLNAASPTIALINVAVDSSGAKRGAISIGITYQNLTLRGSKPQTVQV